MDMRLRHVAEEGDIEAFYGLVGMEPNILKHIDEIPFVETPFHVAASLGHTEFALEMKRLNPSFTRKLNQDGLTPMHLALQNNREQLVRRLVRAEPALVRVDGREGETPLHYAAARGNVGLLIKFLSACPDSIKDVTIRNETAFHFALKYNMVGAFHALLGFLEWGPYGNSPGFKKTILNTKNNEGDTVLHIATSMNLNQVVRALLRNSVAVNKKNLRGLTALDINLHGERENQEIKHMLRRARALRASDIGEKRHTRLDNLKFYTYF